MLIGIHPVLSGELLKVLDEMGHGDQLMLVDRNYPALASGRPVIHAGDTGVDIIAREILSLFPLDTTVATPLERMATEPSAELVPEAAEAILGYARKQLGASAQFSLIPRTEFYVRARSVFAIVHTLDHRPYGCFVFTKGVVFD